MGKKLGGLGIVVVIVLLVVLLTSLGSGFGFGPGKGKGEGEGNGIAMENTSEQASEAESIATTETVNRTNNKLVVAVSVVENDYFYQNKKTTLEDFVSELEALEEDFVVEVTDDNASLKAYKNLTDKLDELHYTYVEATP